MTIRLKRTVNIAVEADVSENLVLCEAIADLLTETAKNMRNGTASSPAAGSVTLTEHGIRGIDTVKLTWTSTSERTSE